jgi:hypothetical protein
MQSVPTKESEPYLKGKNTVYLWSFVGINLAVFFSLVVGKVFPVSLPSIEHFWERITAKDGIIAAAIPLAVIVLTGSLSDTAKARLVFWRWRNPLPGCRAFSKLIATDPRIDSAILAKRFAPLPVAPEEQNSLWYSIYREHKKTRMVWEAHRIYLLTRDMATIAAAFLLLLPIGTTLASADCKTIVLYMIALGCQYLLIATSARNYGNRFVLDVLCEESSRPED